MKHTLSFENKHFSFSFFITSMYYWLFQYSWIFSFESVYGCTWSLAWATNLCMKYFKGKQVRFLGCQSPNFWYKNHRGLKFGRVRVLGQGFNLAGALGTIFAGTGPAVNGPLRRGWDWGQSKNIILIFNLTIIFAGAGAKVKINLIN